MVLSCTRLGVGCVHVFMCTTTTGSESQARPATVEINENMNECHAEVPEGRDMRTDEYHRAGSAYSSPNRFHVQYRISILILCVGI